MQSVLRPAVRRRVPAYTIAAAAAILVVLTGYIVSVAVNASAAPVLLSQGKPATASSAENATFPASAAFDGSTGTRWSSAFGDPQWIQVDLGATATINQVILTWEAAYARSFQIQVSGSATGPWTNIYTTTTGTGGVQTLSVTGTGRYVRMNGTVRATPYGYSLWEFIVRTGTSTWPTASPTPTPTPTTSPTPDPGGFWGDTTSIPPAQNVLTVKILNRTNGQYPDSQGLLELQRRRAIDRRAAVF